jgi:type I restriction enzyme S subunit
MKFEAKTLKEISGGGSYGLGASAEQRPVGPKFLRTTDIVSGTIDWDTVPYCEADAATIDKYRLHTNDIVISRTGANAGINCIVTQPPVNAIFAGYLVRFQIDERVADSHFVSYVLRSARWADYVANTRTGSAQPQLNAVLMGNFSFPLPPLGMQTAISRILKVLDEKIEVNKRISRTLEETAQAIFKSWFIDFDPVKAKMAGEKPAGMDDAAAALFPDSLEDSELGQVPKGWRWGSVGDIANVVDCLHSKKPELLDNGRPYLQLDTINDDGILRFENAALVSEVDYEKWTSRIEVQGGDCVITNVGRVGAVSQIPNHFKGAIGRNITAIRPIDNQLFQTFIAVALASSFMKKEIRSNTDSGTILEALNVRSIPKLRIPIASNQLFEVFEQTCGPIQSQRQNLHLENVRLAQLRDALLPRLISGELQIPEEMLAS